MSGAVVMESGPRWGDAAVEQARSTAARPIRIDPRLADVAWVVALAALLGASRGLGEVATYRLGLIVITATAVLGMHVLVNWAGQISLAEGAFVGVPAFVVARLASERGLPATATLPTGVAVGVAIGIFVSLPALRVKGIQVAITTLLFGVAADQFLFQNPAFTGSAIVSVPPLTLGSRILSTSHDLFPLLLATFAVCLWFTRRLERSSVKRAFLLVKAGDDLAESVGVRAPRYRIFAYAYAGALAGVAAAMQAYWIQQVGPASYSVSFSLLILTIAIVGGNGSLLGPLLAAVVFVAHDVPDWLPPVTLLVVVVMLPGGLNEIGRRLLALAGRTLRTSST